jgi:hypothetical protein
LFLFSFTFSAAAAPSRAAHIIIARRLAVSRRISFDTTIRVRFFARSQALAGLQASSACQSIRRRPEARQAALRGVLGGDEVFDDDVISEARYLHLTSRIAFPVRACRARVSTCSAMQQTHNDVA